MAAYQAIKLVTAKTNSPSHQPPHFRQAGGMQTQVFISSTQHASLHIHHEHKCTVYSLRAGSLSTEDVMFIAYIHNHPVPVQVSWRSNSRMA